MKQQSLVGQSQVLLRQKRNLKNNGSKPGDCEVFALVFLYIECLAGEGKLDLFGFEALHNFQVDPLVDLVV